MIPKIIHYCWFGGSELPENMQRCMESWKRYCPDYEIRRWDESNYDFRGIAYAAEAYQAKKWGFVTDAIRLDIIYRYGGIYLDTDVELLKPLDDLLEHSAFFGFEGGRQVNTGVGFGAEKGHPIVEGNLKMYEDRHFLNPDGSMNLLPCPAITTMYLENLGLTREDRLQQVGGAVIYPREFFSPQLLENGNAETTENTYSIHHYAASWMSPQERAQEQKRIRIYTRYGKKVLLIYDGVNLLRKHGFGLFWNRLWERLRGE